MNTNSFELHARLFKALMHPVRLAILEILRNGEECVCHLEAHLGYRQAYISQQLAVLRAAGLVQDRRDGWNIYYQVSRPEIYRLLDTAGEMLGVKPPLEFPRNLDQNCTCPKCSLETASEI